MSITSKESDRLVDALRRSLLYQTPIEINVDHSSQIPAWMGVHIPYGLYMEIMDIITRAGGWSLGHEQKLEIIRDHENKARMAIGGGVSYDLSGLSYGDLRQIHMELEGIEEFDEFRRAVDAELSSYVTNQGDGAS